jgi:hypothetical protein
MVEPWGLRAALTPAALAAAPLPSRSSSRGTRRGRAVRRPHPTLISTSGPVDGGKAERQRWRRRAAVRILPGARGSRSGATATVSDGRTAPAAARCRDEKELERHARSGHGAAPRLPCCVSSCCAALLLLRRGRASRRAHVVARRALRSSASRHHRVSHQAHKPPLAPVGRAHQVRAPLSQPVCSSSAVHPGARLSAGNSTFQRLVWCLLVPSRVRNSHARPCHCAHSSDAMAKSKAGSSASRAAAAAADESGHSLCVSLARVAWVEQAARNAGPVVVSVTARLLRSATWALSAAVKGYLQRRGGRAVRDWWHTGAARPCTGHSCLCCVDTWRRRTFMQGRRCMSLAVGEAYAGRLGNVSAAVLCASRRCDASRRLRVTPCSAWLASPRVDLLAALRGTRQARSPRRRYLWTRSAHCMPWALCISPAVAAHGLRGQPAHVPPRRDQHPLSLSLPISANTAPPMQRPRRHRDGQGQGLPGVAWCGESGNVRYLARVQRAARTGYWPSSTEAHRATGGCCCAPQPQPRRSGRCEHGGRRARPSTCCCAAETFRSSPRAVLPLHARRTSSQRALGLALPHSVIAAPQADTHAARSATRRTCPPRCALRRRSRAPSLCASSRMPTSALPLALYLSCTCR